MVWYNHSNSNYLTIIPNVHFNTLLTSSNETPLTQCSLIIILPLKLAVKIFCRSSLELSDITTTTARTRRMNLDELYLPNRCYDQGFWQEVELEI